MKIEDIIGQKAVKERLIAEADNGRLPHVLLFTGPEGCGKMPMALALARYLCCANGDTRALKQWESLTHPDVHFVFPIVANKKLKKEVCDDLLPLWRTMLLENPYFSFADWLEKLEVENSQPTIYSRESDVLQRKLGMKPAEGQWRIVIIWLPEKMQEEGANKLLKILEEPPRQTLFLLVSEEPQKLLTTVISRTQQVAMPRLEDEDISLALQERMGINADDAKNIAHLAAGNYIRALKTILTNGDSTGMLGHFTSMMRLAWSRKVKDMKAWSDEMAAMGRERQKAFLLYAARMIRENFTANLHRPELNYMTVQEQQFSVRFAPFISERNAMGIMDELQEASVHIEQNVNAKMVFFDLMLQLTVLIKNH